MSLHETPKEAIPVNSGIYPTLRCFGLPGNNMEPPKQDYCHLRKQLHGVPGFIGGGSWVMCERLSPVCTLRQ